MKKILSVILTMLLIFTIIPMGTVDVLAATTVSDLGIELGTDAGITRAEWLHNLVVVFNMTVEDDALPDNYFSDLTEEHEYYSDIILAVEFGVVDIEAGEELCPDDYVTRDFAASTLNFCLGYQLEEGAEYTFTDYESCSSPDSAQIAVDRGWLKLSGDCFEPTTLVTSAETEAMFTDAANILEEAVVDTEYDSTYDFADDVIVVEKGTVVSEDENGVVSITDCPETISVGDKFAVYHEEIPCVYVAETVTVENGVTKIATSIVEAEEAYTDVDAQGQADAGAMEIIPADDVEISFEEEANPVATFASGTKTIKTINVKKTITLTNAGKATVSVKIKNPVVDYAVNKSYVYVALNGTTEINYGIKMDMLTATGSSKQITLFTCNVAGVGSFDVNVNLSCEGSASGNVTGYLTAGIECVKGDHIRAVKGFTQSQYYTNVEATANVGLRASLGVTHLPFVDASIYAEVGANARLSSTTYSGTELPKKCTHFSAYMYALYGAYASVDFGVWGKTFNKSYEIFGYSNSPVRIVHHYEDGMPVPKCTRGTSYANFFTNGYSHWSGSGWMGANGAYGLYGDGTYFPLYNYTLDENNNATITKYNGNSWSVYIPEDIDGYTVTTIGNSAFEGKNARFINIPDTVTRIEEAAFRNCYYLSNITIPDTVTFIDNGAFMSCTSLVSIDLPDSILNLGSGYACSGVFQNCTSLKYVKMPKYLEHLGEDTFNGCIELEEIFIPKTIKSTGYYGSALANCDKLKTITIEDGITTIPADLFSNCSSIETIEIPDTVTFIDNGAFMSCTSLVSIDLPDSILNLGSGYACSGVFQNCTSLKYVKMPKYLEHLGEDTFNGCIELEEIFIPKTVKSTGYYGSALANCDKLKTITIENGMTTIPADLFSNCSSIETIEIPDTVTFIDNGAFKNCTSLISIDLPDSVLRLGSSYYCSGAFQNCASLKNVKMPKYLEYLGENTFNGCIELEEIFIPKTVKSTGYYGSALANCDKLKTITIENGMTTIPEDLFSNCSSIETIEIPSSVRVIGVGSFAGCKGLTEIEIPNGVEKIDTGAFQNCTSLKSVDISNKKIELAGGIFSGCSSLESAKLPEHIEEITSSMFSNCTSLKDIDIPQNVKTIQNSAFYGCSSLKEVNLPETLETIGSYAFQNCSTLEKVIIPKYVVSIGTNAFMGCEALSTVDIADYSIQEIKTDTFKDCPGLTRIVLPKGLTKIGSQAFMNDTSLTEVVIPESVTSIDSTAFSYPAKTTIYGKTGSYAETFATEGGFKFSENSIPVEGIILKDGVESITLDVGETYRAEFEVYPEDANDVITVTADNTNVTVTGHNIYARYTGDTVITATATSGLSYVFNVHIRRANSITITKQPTKLSYLMGESLDLSGMKVQVVYNDGSVKYVTDYTVSGFDSSVEGTSSVTVQWIAANGSKLTTTFDVEIVDPTPKVTGIFIETLPTKVQYELREKLDLTGMVVKANYTDGSVKEITDYTTSGFNALKNAAQVITVTYNGFTTTFTVFVGDVPTEHNYGDWVIDKEATCTESGSRHKTCSLCGDVVTETITATGHNYSTNWTIDKKATCTEKGSKSHHCLNCDSKTDVTVISAIGHSASSWITDKKATVNAKGKKHKECTECGEILETATIKQLKCSKPKLKTISNTEYGVKITWGKVSGADTYRVYRKTKSGSWKYLGSTSKTGYTDKTAKSGTKYYYAVRARNEAGNSSLSSSLSKLYLADPTLKTPKSTKSGISLKWTKTTGAQGYIIYRKTGSGSYKKLKTEKGVSNLSYVDKSAKKGKKYTYKVKAYYSKTYSAYSNTKTIKDKY